MGGDFCGDKELPHGLLCQPIFQLEPELIIQSDFWTEQSTAFKIKVDVGVGACVVQALKHIQGL